MTCTSPLRAYRQEGGGVSFKETRDTHSELTLACGQCQSCRLARAGSWAARVMHEASLYGDNNTFLTLTYSDQAEPPNRSLRYSDFQSFMRRLVYTSRQSVRFYMCGEYSPENHRPHYHACLFNITFPDQHFYKKTDQGHICYSSPTLDKLWQHGYHTVAPLNYQTAAYTARYCMKKRTGHQAAAYYGEREPEFNRMSLRPGVGAEWLNRFHHDVFDHDRMIVNGTEQPVPKYYRKLRARAAEQFRDARTLNNIEDQLQERIARAALHQSDNTPERLAVKAQVVAARIATLKRNLE